ncbi:S-layer homology domain-containing protein [Cohnella caldifontis]|uniref:S-layer homology domain-containing protein n=1 Tax=Cohnella caldifontis TaxID=3027471 RepID=UPI0023EBB893|nr:S-layer homology domain-containing protein [Cohnella sp. YIM B05605]
MKKLGPLGMLIVASLLAAPSIHAQESKPVAGWREFKDVAGTYWAKAQIDKAAADGYVSGFSDGTFRPERKVSRAEFFRMLVDALKLPHVAKGSPWYQPYVAVMVEFNFHNASDFKEYTENLSRLEMIRLAARAVHLDFQSVGVTEQEFVVWAAESGLIYGSSIDGDLELDGSVTRAEAIVVIQRVLTLIKGKVLDVNPEAVKAAKQM